MTPQTPPAGPLKLNNADRSALWDSVRWRGPYLYHPRKMARLAELGLAEPYIVDDHPYRGRTAYRATEAGRAIVAAWRAALGGADAAPPQPTPAPV